MIPNKAKPANEVFDYLNFIFKVMTENQSFLLNSDKGKKTCDEVIELCNDAIDQASYFAKREDNISEYVRFAMASFTFQVLMPQSNAIYANLLLGNIVACFNELRLMTESLAICYWADLKFPKQSFFQEKFQLLGEERKEKSVSKYLRDLDKEAITLWGQLSQGWVHTKGIMDRLVIEITEKSEVSAWALTIPIAYTLGDVDTVDELGRKVSQFRALLRATVDRWKGNILKDQR